MACADQLNSVGHEVTVFEKEDRVGGLLMYGIPNFKLDKKIVKRRINLMQESEGVFIQKLEAETAIANFIKATRKGLFKIIAKMGISTIQSYRGAQVFEVVGLSEKVVELYFTGTPSRISGAELDILAEEALTRHKKGFGTEVASILELGGHYHWRRGEEKHMLNPNAIGLLQHATRSNDYAIFKKFLRKWRVTLFLVS